MVAFITDIAHHLLNFKLKYLEKFGGFLVYMLAAKKRMMWVASAFINERNLRAFEYKNNFLIDDDMRWVVRARLSHINTWKWELNGERRCLNEISKKDNVKLGN